MYKRSAIINAYLGLAKGLSTRVQSVLQHPRNFAPATRTMRSGPGVALPIRPSMLVSNMQSMSAFLQGWHPTLPPSIFSRSDETLKFRQAQSSEELRKAQQLLHWEFVEQQGWKPTPGNPSEWRVEQLPSDHTGEHTPFLTDVYDDLSTWFVCMAEHRVLGVCRVVEADKSGRTEVERYTHLPEDVTSMGPLFEINRGVLHPDARHGPLLLVALLQALKHIYSQGGTAICASPEPRIQRALSKLGLTSVKKFKYEPLRDNEPEAELFVCSPSSIPFAMLRLRAALLSRRCHQLLAGFMKHRVDLPRITFALHSEHARVK